MAYLQNGNQKQHRAFNVINELGILVDLAKYNPVLCGTIPISIDVEGSDLDIAMEVYDFEVFKQEVNSLYDKFVIKEKTICSIPTVKVNFEFGGFEFELFGQPQAIELQNAYRHIVIEQQLLTQYPSIRNEILRLKEAGLKTEPAFAQVLGLKGDPYEAILALEKNGGEGLQLNSVHRI